MLDAELAKLYEVGTRMLNKILPYFQKTVLLTCSENQFINLILGMFNSDVTKIEDLNN